MGRSLLLPALFSVALNDVLLCLWAKDVKGDAGNITAGAVGAEVGNGVAITPYMEFSVRGKTASLQGVVLPAEAMARVAAVDRIVRERVALGPMQIGRAHV